MNNRISIGKRIAELRKQKGWSQAELAEKCKMAPGNIARIETGKYSTGVDLLGKIADALGFEIDFVPIRIIAN